MEIFLDTFQTMNFREIANVLRKVKEKKYTYISSRKPGKGNQCCDALKCSTMEKEDIFRIPCFYFSNGNKRFRSEAAYTK